MVARAEIYFSSRAFLRFGGIMTEATERLAHPIDEAAHMIGSSRATIYRLVKTGQLRMVKILGRSVITRESIDALLRGGAA